MKVPPQALGARGHADLRRGLPRGVEAGAQLLEGTEEVPADVVPEGAQGRYVEDADAAGLRRAARETLDRPEERRQGLAAPGRSDREDVLARGDPRPGQPLDLGRLAVALPEPPLDDGVHVTILW